MRRSISGSMQICDSVSFLLYHYLMLTRSKKRQVGLKKDNHDFLLIIKMEGGRMSPKSNVTERLDCLDGEANFL